MTHGFSKSSNCDRFRYSVCVSLLPTCVLSRFRALRIAIIDHARVRTAHDDKAWMSKDPAPGFCHTWGNDRPTVAHFPPVKIWSRITSRIAEAVVSFPQSPFWIKERGMDGYAAEVEQN